MAIQTLYPLVQPSLLLDFANVKALDPRITFTRASSARFYNGVTTAKAEENLVLQSQTFDQSPWGLAPSMTVTANSTAAPDGTSTADTLTGSGLSATQRAAQLVTAGGACVFSCFVKKNTNDFVQFYFAGDNTSFANFDVATGVVGTTGGTVTSSIVDVGSGWYRCIAVNTSTAVTTVAINIVDSASATRAQATTLTTSLFLWGAQLEQRSAVTAYTPTTTQPITNYIPVLQSAADNVARFDHSPTTGESLGFLVEESRSNLLLQSEDLSTTWTTAATTIETNVAIAPDGTLTADRIITDTTSAFHGVNQAITVVSGTAYTFSVFAKPFGNNILRVGFSSVRFGTAVGYFNLSTGVLGTFTGATGTITPAGNGWYRCSLTATATSSGSGTNSLIYSSQSDNQGAYVGDGWSGLLAWGSQFEAGAFPTSYIPTVASQVTRAADTASMTGANFSDWYRADEGTLYAEYRVSEKTTTVYGAAINDGTLNNVIGIGQVFTNRRPLGYIKSNNSDQAILTVDAPLAAGVYLRNTLSYKFNDSASSANATTVQTDTSVIVPIVSQMNIGNWPSAGGTNINGTIKKIAFYPQRLSNANLVALTS
jgi:hypothetical protein